MIRKVLLFIFAGLMLSGCYASSLTYVGTGAGVVQGKSVQSLGAQFASSAIKKETGKSPLEHVLNPKQIKTYESAKSKINPCEQTPELCSKIKLRVALINSVLKNKDISEDLNNN